MEFISSYGYDDLDFPGLSYSNLLKSGRVTPHFYGFESSFTNKSRIYDLKSYGRPDFSDGRTITFTNGMNNSFDAARELLLELSDLADGYNLTAVYNASHGFFPDLLECFMGLC